MRDSIKYKRENINPPFHYRVDLNGKKREIRLVIRKKVTMISNLIRKERK